MPLVDPKSVYQPPLHIKLGLIKNFVKTMEVEENGFYYFENRFCSEKCNAKLKADVFIRLESCSSIKDLDKF